MLCGKAHKGKDTRRFRRAWSVCGSKDETSVMGSYRGLVSVERGGTLFQDRSWKVWMINTKRGTRTEWSQKDPVTY